MPNGISRELRSVRERRGYAATEGLCRCAIFRILKAGSVLLAPLTRSVTR
jgi:hypothetical protein